MVRIFDWVMMAMMDLGLWSDDGRGGGRGHRDARARARSLCVQAYSLQQWRVVCPRSLRPPRRHYSQWSAEPGPWRPGRPPPALLSAPFASHTTSSPTMAHERARAALSSRSSPSLLVASVLSLLSFPAFAQLSNKRLSLVRLVNNKPLLN
jgi:hypothetical protein